MTCGYSVAYSSNVLLRKLSDAALPLRKTLWLFLVVELALVLGFLGLMAVGRAPLAAALLLLPWQVLIVALSVEDDFRMLVFFVAVYPLTTLVLVPYQYEMYVYYPITVGLLTLSAIAYRLTVPNSTGRPPLPKHLGTLLFLVVCSCLVSTFHAKSVGFGSRHLYAQTAFFIQSVAVTYFLAKIPRSLAQVRVLVTVLVLSMAVAALAIPFLPTPTGEGGALGGKRLETPFGIQNLNAYATIVAVTLAIVVGDVIAPNRSLGRRFLMIVIGLGLFAVLLMTKSRGAWLGFGLAVLYFVVRARSLTTILGTAVFGLLLLLSDLLRNIVTVRAAETSVVDPSFLGRLLLWRYALRVFADNWLFGVGIDNFGMVKHFYGYPFSAATSSRYGTHNLFLEGLAGLGIVGSMVLVTLIVVTMVSLDRAVRHGGESRALGMSLSAGMLAYLAHGLWDCFTWSRPASMIFGLVIGLGISVVRLQRPFETVESVPGAAGSTKRPTAGQTSGRQNGLGGVVPLESLGLFRTSPGQAGAQSFVRYHTEEFTGNVRD